MHMQKKKYQRASGSQPLTSPPQENALPTVTHRTFIYQSVLYEASVLRERYFKTKNTVIITSYMESPRWARLLKNTKVKTPKNTQELIGGEGRVVPFVSSILIEMHYT